MINKELKRLSRRELVDIIYQMKKNEQEMQDKITALENEIKDKRIRISQAGSIADAAVNVTNVFSAAQVTADMYLSEIASMKKDTEAECAKMIADAKQRVKNILADGQKQYDNLNAHYQNDYKKWKQLQAEIQNLKNID